MILLEELSLNSIWKIDCPRQPSLSGEVRNVDCAKLNVCCLRFDLNFRVWSQQVRAQANDAEIRLVDPGNALHKHRNALAVNYNLSRAAEAGLSTPPGTR